MYFLMMKKLIIFLLTNKIIIYIWETFLKMKIIKIKVFLHWKFVNLNFHNLQYMINLMFKFIINMIKKSSMNKWQLSSKNNNYWKIFNINLINYMLEENLF